MIRLTKVDTFEPAIILDKHMKDGIDGADFDTYETTAPFLVDKITTHKNSVWNEAMTFLGINNANQDKKERMNQKETTSNDSQVAISLLSMFKERKNACKLINEMFGTDIDVVSREREWDMSYTQEPIVKEKM